MEKFQMKTKKNGKWENCYPVTLGELVEIEGKKLTEILKEKPKAEEIGNLSKVATSGDFQDLINLPENATEDKNGLMSKEDKSKLDKLQNYVHPDNENTRHVTDEEKAKWNNTYTKEEIDEKIKNDGINTKHQLESNLFIGEEEPKEKQVEYWLEIIE